MWKKAKFTILSEYTACKAMLKCGAKNPYKKAPQEKRAFLHYKSMKCRKQFRYNKLDIANLWEVHLGMDTWQKLKQAAVYNRCTITWISRYCVFRLVRGTDVLPAFAMDFHSNEAKSEYLFQRKNKKIHRHIICLYGDDEKLLRLAAMELNITVSHLIRLALHMYLPIVAQRYFAWKYIYYYGLKLCMKLKKMRINDLNMPHLDVFRYIKWPRNLWWRQPYQRIVIPYGPPDPNIKLNYDFIYWPFDK